GQCLVKSTNPPSRAYDGPPGCPRSKSSEPGAIPVGDSPPRGIPNRQSGDPNTPRLRGATPASRPGSPSIVSLARGAEWHWSPVLPGRHSLARSPGGTGSATWRFHREYTRGADGRVRLRVANSGRVGGSPGKDPLHPGSTEGCRALRRECTPA